YAIRKKGRFFRASQGYYVAGFIIIIIMGGTLPWLLIFISMFIPDVIVMNTKSELRQEDRKAEKEQQEEVIVQEQQYEDKKKQIEDLKRLRDNGIITEEEYKERLFEIL
ncbi:MAG: SHOCT domain-containing protein, partial [Clostridia bacterium]|nr:SHOCT domain-containing protein [Clostridia bacterium]